MRNFDYIKDIGLNDLHKFCSAAEEYQQSNPDFSAVNARKALEYIVRALYFMKNIEVKEKDSLFQLVDGEPFREFINDERVMTYKGHHVHLHQLILCHHHYQLN